MSTTLTTPDSGLLQEICRRYNARRLSLFGSAVREELRDGRDVDLLVEFRAGYTPTYLELGALSDELSPLFDGRVIDLVTYDNLHWFVRDRVLASARLLYVGCLHAQAETSRAAGL